MFQDHKDSDVSGIMLFVLRWWKTIASIGFIAAVGAAVFSAPIFITPKYDATIVLFPATSASLSRSVLGGPGAAPDFLQYGDIVAAERLLQVVASGAVRDRIEERFNLMEHYEIEEHERFRKFRFQRMYSQNVSARRTPFGAIEITVRDKDPALAARMANEIAALADTVKNEIRRQRARQAYEVAKAHYQAYLNDLNELNDSLRVIMEAGVYDILGQSGMLHRQLAIDLSAGNTRGAEAIKNRLNVLGEKGGQYIFLTTSIQNLSENHVVAHRRMLEAKSDYENFMTYQFVVDPAIEPDKKSFPTRWLLVVLVSLSASLLGAFVIMLFEQMAEKGIIKRRP